MPRQKVALAARIIAARFALEGAYELHVGNGVISAEPAFAHYTRATQRTPLAERGDEYGRAMTCMGFVRGVVEGIGVQAIVVETRGLFCPPAGVA